MSTNYAGKSKNIIASTNSAGSVEIQATAHGYTTGSTVFIAGHDAGTGANGEWVVTVVDADHFTIGAPYVVDGGIAGEVTAFVGSVQEPSDGDLGIKAADVNPGFEAAGDRAQVFLSDYRARLKGLHSLSPSQSITRTVSGTPTANATTWAPNTGIDSGPTPAGPKSIANGALCRAVAWTQQLVDSDYTLLIPIDIPHGATWTGYTCTYRNAANDVPTNKPVVTPWKIDKTTAVSSVLAGLGSVTDPTTLDANYQSPHAISKTGGTEIIDRTQYDYFLAFNGEHDAGAAKPAIEGGEYFGSSVTYTLHSLPIGGA